MHSMDRLARNLDDLRSLVRRLTKKGVRIEFLKEHLLFTGENSPMVKLMPSIMGAFAESGSPCMSACSHWLRRLVLTSKGSGQ